ncbi:MAG TPA: AraC family transcriptional regulator [Puia sp.]|nr:AraC family transcriptional regulator [Puia sp.]
MFLEEPILLVVLEGTSVITIGKMEFTLRKNEMVVLKMLELLYDLTSTDKNLLQQLLQLRQQVYADIPAMVEENYANPVSLSDLAYLCGRSLSSFKRDFYAIYQTTPATWIREKRLSKAREMLRAGMGVKEVCYSLGFGSPAHFSRLFKSYFGQTPKTMKVVQAGAGIRG